MDRFAITILLASAVLISPVSVSAQDTPPAPTVPLLSILEQPGKGEEYVAAARRFMRDHGDSPDAPRVLSDLIMLFGIFGQTEEEQQYKQYLLLAHPVSPYAAAAIRNFESAEKCREFLTDFHKRCVLGAPDSPALPQFTLGAQYGLLRFKDELLSDDDFLLHCAAASRSVGMEPLFSRVKQKLGASNEEIRQIAAVVLDDDASASDRFIQLQPFMKRTSVRQIQSLLWTKAGKDAPSTPVLISTRVENLLRDSEFKAAYPLLRALNESGGNSQIALWTGWAATAAGDLPAATAAFNSLASDSQDATTRAVAARLSVALQSSSQALKLQTDTLLKVSQRLLAIQPAIELAGRFTPEDGAPLEFYLALDQGSDFLEVLLSRNGQVMAIRIDGEQGIVLLPDEQVQHVFESGAAIPQPRFEFGTTPDGGLKFNFNTNIGDSEDAASDPLRALFGSPLLSTRDGLRKLLEARIQRGTLPEFKLEQDSENRVLTWLSFDPDSPQPTITELVVSPNDQLKSIRLDQLTINRIRYEERGSFQFAPPQWPDHPIQRHESLPPSMMFRLFSVFSTLMESDG